MSRGESPYCTASVKDTITLARYFQQARAQKEIQTNAMMRNRKVISQKYWFWKCTTLEGLPKVNVSCLAVIQVYTTFLLRWERWNCHLWRSWEIQVFSQQHEWCSGLSQLVLQNKTLLCCFIINVLPRNNPICVIRLIYYFPVSFSQCTGSIPICYEIPLCFSSIFKDKVSVV